MNQVPAFQKIDMGLAELKMKKQQQCFNLLFCHCSPAGTGSLSVPSEVKGQRGFLVLNSSQLQVENSRSVWNDQHWWTLRFQSFEFSSEQSKFEDEPGLRGGDGED